MAQSETTKPQLTSTTKLSAEADSFVPGHLASGGGRHQQPPNGRLSPGQKSMTPQQLSQLPRYMTSCYPFVQGDPGPGPRSSGGSAGSGTFQGPGRPPAPNYTSQRMPAPQSGGYNFPGTRPPGPQNYGGGRGSRHQGLLPRPGFTSGNSASHQGPNQALLGPHPFPAGSGQLPLPGAPGGRGFPYYPYGSHVPQTSVWSTPNGVFPPDYGASFAQGFGYPPGYPVEGTEWNGTERVPPSGDKDRKSKKRKEKSNMVSVGVQNESPGMAGPLTKQKKQKTKTIILMDAAMQTDFSEEIANLTLAQKPNSLYKTGSWPDEYDPDNSCTTTDSEEVDSDSGYSSPLHRRNQMSNGTHPVGGTYPSIMASEGQGLLPSPGINPHLHHSHSHTQAFPFITSPAAAAGTIPFSYSAVAAGSTGGGYNSAYMQTFSHHTPTSVGNLDSHLHSVGLNVNGTRGSHGTNSTSSTHPLSTSNKTEPEEDDASCSVKKKRRRNRRRRKKTASGEDIGALSDEPVELHRAHSSSNVSRTSTEPPNMDLADTSGLRFEDEDEFPNLMSAAASLEAKTSSQPVMSYSEILKTPALPHCQDQSIVANGQFSSSGSPEFDKISNGTGASKESKNARKRRKRREMANKAAEEELAEITLEQQVLRELSAKHHQPSQQNVAATMAPSNAESPAAPGAAPTAAPTLSAPQKAPVQAPVPKAQPAGKKSKQPISLNIADMIDALEKQQEQQKAQERQGAALAGVRKPADKNMMVVNLLDASAPAKRGKEREVPKPKKPSPLKKVILKEREEKKRMRLLDEPMSPESEEAASQMLAVPGLPLDSDLSQDDSKTSSADTEVLTPMSAEMSPISQNSPISMSPLSPGGSPLSSGINSPVASNSMLGERKPQVVMKIHSRRFREYCTQILDKDIDNCCTVLLQDLVRFQDRLYHKDLTKAKSKRRIVLGLREVTKHLRLKKIKVVIISPNLERIQSKGGLDEALNNIIQMCTDQEVPFVFALGRRALGRACAKLVPVSVVGIFSYEGSEENFHNLMDLTEVARKAYTEMVSVLEKEQQENPGRQAGTFPPYYAHMGHSRTPSACSAISFTSSILSEPISENYPQSEPETDSRGYEIIREALIRDSAQEEASGQTKGEASAKSEEPVSDTEDLDSSGKVTIVESLDEIDEGHEADTEDSHETSWPKKGSKPEQVSDDGDGDDGDDEEEEENEGDDKDGYENDSDSDDSHDDEEDGTECDRDTVRELPHIDSIHSSVIDLSTEILSQHSSKTLDLNTEVLSTHSSKAPGESCTAQASSSPGAGDHTAGQVEKTGDNCVDPVSGGSTSATGGTTHKLRTPDKERIESWVAETQQHMEKLSVQVEGDDPTETVVDASGLSTAAKEDSLNDNHTQQPGCCSVCDAQHAS